MFFDALNSNINIKNLEIAAFKKYQQIASVVYKALVDVNAVNTPVGRVAILQAR